MRRQAGKRFRATTEALRDAFSDVEVTPEEVISEGDTVSVRMTQCGTREGAFLGVAPTGNSFEIVATAVARLEDGTVVERWVQPDLLWLMERLGAVELSGAYTTARSSNQLFVYF